jgi:serine/threonine-protein kinase
MPERLTTSRNPQFPTSISPNGKLLIFSELDPSNGRDLFMVTLDREHRVSPLLRTPSNELNAVISPNGRWMAYESDASTRSEIYVRPFPNTQSAQYQLTTAGGTRPVWAHSGKELFFVTPEGALEAVSVDTTAPTWRSGGTPTKVLEPRYFTGAGTLGPTYDVSSDDKKFLMIKLTGVDSTSNGQAQLIVVQHFDEELKRLAPAK